MWGACPSHNVAFHYPHAHARHNSSSSKLPVSWQQVAAHNKPANPSGLFAIESSWRAGAGLAPISVGNWQLPSTLSPMSDSESEVLVGKRGHGELAAVGQLAGRKRAAGDSQPADGPSFSEELLRLYYDRLFPYDAMFEWLAYGHGSCAA